MNSKIQYGLEVYGHAGSTVIRRVQTQQKKALKILFNRDFRTRTEKLHCDLNLLTVKDTHHLSIAKFVHKQIHGKLPAIFNSYFIPSQTRTDNIIINQQTTERGKKSMEHFGATIWNKIPSNLKKIHDTKRFSKELKKIWVSVYR